MGFLETGGTNHSSGVTMHRTLVIAAALLACTSNLAVTHVIDGTLPDGGDCPLFGEWNAAAQSCRVTDATVQEGDILRILSATLEIDGTLTNEGMVNSSGLIVNNGFLNSTNDLVNFWDGSMINRGEFFSHFMYNFGGLVNEPGASIVFELHLENNAPLLNQGSVEVIGNFANIPGRVIENVGTMTLAPTANFNNAGLFVHAGTLDNAGRLTNDGNFVEHCESVVVGNPIEGTPSTPAQSLDVGPASLEWCAIEGATGYDVVEGDLALLRASGGDFTTAVLGCVGNNVELLSLEHGVQPATDQGVWFLVRANGTGGASYESGFSSQLGTRDGEIAGSPHACAGDLSP